MLRVCKGLNNIAANGYLGICVDELYDENIFEISQKKLQENYRLKYISAYSAKGNCFFVFDDNDNSYLKNVYIQELKTLRKHGKIGFYQIFSDVESVCLHGVNELSLELYYYLIENNVECHLVGDEWEILGTKVEIITEHESLHLKNRMDIYSDGRNFVYKEDIFYREPVISSEYNFINGAIAWENYVEQIRQTAMELCKSGVFTGLVNFPDNKDLCLNDDEKYCQENLVTIYEYSTKKPNKEHYEQLCSIYGKKHVEQYLNGETQKNRITNYHNGCVFYSAIEEERKNNIYIIGPCVVWQEDLMPEDTIVHLLQKQFDKNEKNYKVTSVSVATEYFNLIEDIISGMLIRDGDIVLFACFRLSHLEGFPSDQIIELKDIYDNRKERYFSNHTFHINQKCSGLIADKIYSFISQRKKEHKGLICRFPNSMDEGELITIDNYIKKVKPLIGDKNDCKRGCIVMNCNPYTKGHDYLINKASEMVDELIVFVVEENKSFFRFFERMEMVVDNTKKYRNVRVVPSGRMVLSGKTLPTYFVKEEKQDAVLNASMDLKLFALGIAPRLGIKVRFVGEEPTDGVTAQYNAQMHEILPHYGIEVVEIQRLKVGNKVISASEVRKNIKGKNIESVRELLTEESYSYLLEHIDKIGQEIEEAVLTRTDDLLEWYDSNSGNCAIYGAGGVAKAVLKFLLKNKRNLKLHVIKTKLKKDDEREVFGVNVEDAESVLIKNLDLPILVCALSNVGDDIASEAEKYSSNVTRISDTLCEELMQMP